MFSFQELEDTAKELFLARLGEEVSAIDPIVGVGSVNQVVRVMTHRGAYILRMNEGTKAQEYAKEAWCVEAVRAVGIPCPNIIHSGSENDYVYQIQEDIRGVNVSKLPPGAQLLSWYNCGKYVARFTRVPARGFGDQLENFATGQFSDRWSRYLTYNLGALSTRHDSLLDQGHMTMTQYDQLRRLLEGVAKMEVTIGLVHGDLHGRNFIQHYHRTYLLDWGMAELHVYPHVDLARLLAPGLAEVPPLAFTAFRKGLGMSERQLLKILPDIKQIHLLKTLDTYRWAFDHQATVPISRYVTALSRALAWAEKP
ncbi:phosphotransferase family protein [Lewinella sp. W8]|uniref:phosphotransferase family protein n=1 Tax=Lewinella sp. W8 TaxID=2528208 RepID=UPI001067CCE9|nr:aminoglycoside phosphotransferase family protein [Lewinella sp. W8]MTB49584.1 phosphotransferase [Lewinella sp. W8]